ncbi:MAG: response regulator [Planctomycetota bacterium]
MNLNDVTVFIVDDDPAARDSVTALVESMNIRCEGFASAEEFLQAYDPNKPGCLVTDVRLLGMSGLELQEQLAQRRASLPVVVITAHADVPLAVKAMRRGAINILEKPCRQQELWETIRSALNVDAANRKRRANREMVEARLSTLSPEEHEIMKKVVEGVPNKVIAVDLNLSLRTVETRRHNVFRKMQVESLVDLVRLVVDADDKRQEENLP